MDRYHFKTNAQSDVKGIHLADLAAVKCEAAKVAASLVFAASDKVWRNSEWTVTVMDDSGAKVLDLRIVGSQAS